MPYLEKKPKLGNKSLSDLKEFTEEFNKAILIKPDVTVQEVAVSIGMSYPAIVKTISRYFNSL